MQKPILVMLSYRGGDRLRRCLNSIAGAESFFSRIVLSVTAGEDSPDHAMCIDFRDGRLPRSEVICSGVELPTMQHQAFWINYLRSTGARDSDWIYWLAYDDEVSAQGCSEITDTEGRWPLEPHHAYFGPWAVRHEGTDTLWSGSISGQDEVWTAFSINTTGVSSPVKWATEQILQPTYIQMSGSVTTLASHSLLVSRWPKKNGPMRIELATALDPSIDTVTEFHRPITIIYGRPNSDRANYANDVRRQDRHLLLVFARWFVYNPSRLNQFRYLAKSLTISVFRALMRNRPQEEWRIRGRARM